VIRAHETPPASAAEARAATRPAGLSRRLLGLLIIFACLAVAIMASFLVGSRTVSSDVVVDALVGGATGSDADAVRNLRLPRTVLGLLVGMALGVAGALIQAVTRNPLADPGILGVNSGAAFAVAIGVGVLGVTAPLGYVWFAFFGALVTTVFVYFIGAVGRGPVSPARITLAGVAIGAVLAGITTGLVLTNPRGFNAMRAWEAGSFMDRGWEPVSATAWSVGIGVVLALALSPSLNTIALGDDLAQALGANIVRTRILAVVAITLLAGSATAMAGPIAFIGLMIPHIARWIVGPDQRWIIAYSALLAPILALTADVIGRVALPNGELQVGIVTAIVGAPVLIALVRRQRASAL
jgi:iron complex transport system permease protein